ncbi:aminoglycoside phosphotransferase family protein [Streptomyces sp. NPDC048845]|uniref:aminoglycoside phosphotransferase family protein n=1 Tax=Streptomyces sp. NPDC048845 TaxID=3155390 RepID=UPI003417C173
MASAARPGGNAVFEPPRRLVQALDERGAGAAGRAWLESLPALVRDVSERWDLTPDRVHTPGGRSSLLVLVRRADGTPAALKLVPPGHGAEPERRALEHWDGWGAARVLEAAPEAGALLLERLHGEVSLSSLPEAKALLEAAGTARRLWVDPGADHAFETVAERTGRTADALRSAAGEPWAADLLPLLETAAAVREELTAESPEAVLLHGRFRQAKVLSGERSPWLAVGPEPLVGERAYDLARLVRDRLEDLVASPAGAAAARRRVTKLADSLEVDPERLRGWTVFRAVESGVRSLRAGRPREGELLLEFAGWL